MSRRCLRCSPLSPSLLVVGAVALSACGGEVEDVAAPQKAPITQLAILGDSLASGHLIDEGQRYYELLLDNDDIRYPSFEGRDLASFGSDVQLIDLAGPGDSGEATVRQAYTVPPNRTGRTLVVFSIGLNDLALDPARLLSPEGIAAAVTQRAEQARSIVERFNDASRFPHGAILVALEPIDSTDGINRLPDSLQNDVMCRLYEAFVSTGALGLFNQQARASLDVQEVKTLELQRHFIGHGWHHDNTAGPAYDPADPSPWLADCWHPNARGQHEIRRLIWNEISAAEQAL